MTEAPATPRRRWRGADVVFALAMIAVFALAAQGLFRKITWYLAIDQYGYLTFAGDLAEGRVFHRWPPLDALWYFIPFPRVDVLSQTYVFAGDRMYCRYSPGFPMLLAAWIRVFGADAAHYFDPIVFLLLLGVYLALARRFLAREAGARWLALAATLLVLLLPSYLHLWAITILRDIPAQLFAFTAILVALPRARPLTLGRAAVVGATAGYLVCIRIDAALFALPIGTALLLQPRRGGALAVAAGAAAIAVSPLLAYNYASTGHPFRPTQGMEVDSFFEARGPAPPRFAARAWAAKDAKGGVLPIPSAAARRGDSTRHPKTPSHAVGGRTPPDTAGRPDPVVGTVGRTNAAEVRGDADSEAAVAFAPPAPGPPLNRRRAMPPPVQGGGMRFTHLANTLPGNVGYLREALGPVLLVLAIFGMITIVATNRLLLAIAVPYSLGALVLYSFWGRADPRYIAGVLLFGPLVATAGFANLRRIPAFATRVVRRLARPGFGPPRTTATERGRGSATDARPGSEPVAAGAADARAHPLLALALAVGLAVLWRAEIASLGRAAIDAVTSTAWPRGMAAPMATVAYGARVLVATFYAGGSALPMVSGVVATLAVVMAGTAGFARRATTNGWQALALAALLLAIAISRVVPGWQRAPVEFQGSRGSIDVETARRTIEAVVEPGAIVITTTEVGRPAENIDYYTHAHAVYVRDLERWGFSVALAAARFIVSGFDVYLFVPTGSPRGAEALVELGRTQHEVEHVVHVDAADALRYFVASRFGPRPMDLYRLRLPRSLTDRIPGAVPRGD